MKNQHQAVVIGCGAIGPIHAEALSRCEYANLYGVCDIDRTRADVLAKQYGCRTYYDAEEVFCDPHVDAVHICTPHYLHASMCLRAAQSGKQLVVEKPFALNNAEADEVNIQLTRADIAVCCILQNRFAGSIIEAKRRIQSGMYGDVMGAKGILTWQRTPEYYHSADWRGKWDTEGGGLIINQAVHLLDLLTYLAGSCNSMRASIHNRTLQGVIEVEDTAEATLYRNGKAFIQFYATNGYCENSPFDLEIRMQRATLKYTHNRLFEITDSGMTELCSNDSAVLGKDYWGNGHARLIHNFYASLSGLPQPYTTLADGIHGVRLVDALYQSAKTGKEMQI